MAWVLKIEVNVKDWVFKVVKQQYIDIYLVFEAHGVFISWYTGKKNRYYKKCEYQIWVTNMSFYEYVWANIFFVLGTGIYLFWNCYINWLLKYLRLIIPSVISV